MNGQGNVIVGAIIGVFAVIFMVIIFKDRIFPELEKATGVNTPNSFIIAFILLIIAAIVIIIKSRD